jgi:hypothetical protein
LGAAVILHDSGEFESVVGDTIQYAVELGLIMKYAAQGGDALAGLQGEPLETCGEALAQAASDGDDISARFHGFSFAF